ncbi:MAG: TonB family protein, partial [Roseateles sp.]|uniref:TonB family protein n=1 Tax=Roseateles sp. TaxID=1971397 RepID=UPI0040375A9E
GRQEAARAAAARLAAARAEEEQREARLRAIGQQLNEEAARRDAQRDAARPARPDLPSSWSSARRGRLFGRTDANAEMVLYAEGWARKIQLGQAFDLIREVVKQPHTDALVTVAIRSDGTVESVSFFRSSGVPAVDDAIRRVIESQANYPAFPPALAREYDVIEIRRTWRFDMAIRLY